MSGKSNVCKPPHMHQHSLWVWLHLSIGSWVFVNAATYQIIDGI